jgi:hypothetical protein
MMVCPVLLSTPDVLGVLSGGVREITRRASGQWLKLKAHQDAGLLCLLWCKEQFMRSGADLGERIHYRAKPELYLPADGKWEAPMFMPKHASRLTLEVTRMQKAGKNLVVSFRAHEQNINEFINQRRVVRPCAQK